MMAGIRPLLLSGADVAAAAPPLREIAVIVEETYRMDARGETEVPAKLGVHPDRPKSFLHAMPAWVSGARALGVKWVSFFPGNAERGLQDSSGIIVLNDPDTGLPLAIMEGMWITYARTSACAAVAAKHLVRAPPVRLGLVGCGALGQWSLRTLAAMFPSIESVFVASRRPETRRAFCSSMASEGPWRLVAVDETRDAVEAMDIVVSSVPKLEQFPIAGAWWSPGTLMIPLDVTGAWDDDAYRIADRLVCDGAASLRNALARYRPTLALDEKRLVSLQEIVAGRAAGRRDRTDRTLVFITGIASTDITLAQEIFARASRKGLGTPFDLN